MLYTIINERSYWYLLSITYNSTQYESVLDSNSITYLIINESSAFNKILQEKHLSVLSLLLLLFTLEHHLNQMIYSWTINTLLDDMNLPFQTILLNYFPNIDFLHGMMYHWYMFNIHIFCHLYRKFLNIQVSKFCYDIM